MEALFLKLVNMSLTALWLVLAVIGVRFVFRRTPKWVLCLLWGLVGLRLVCPFSIESSLSLIPSAQPLPPEIIYTAKPELQSGISVVDNTINPMLASSMTPMEPASANPTQIWSFIFTRVWLLGAAAMFLYALISYILLRRRVAASIPVRQNIRRCEFIDAPFVLGFFFPKIYLPSALEKRQWDYVLAHEEAHIQRHDNLWKPIAFLLLCIYWFNPLYWVAFTLFCRDMEGACDERVIRRMDLDTRRKYSEALLSASIHRQPVMAHPLAFGEVGIRERIKYVMNYKKPSSWAIWLSAALILFLAVTFLTNPERRYDPEKTYAQSVLPDPDRIYIDVNGTDSVYEKDSEVYRSLVDAFRENWWKYTEDNRDTASDELLTAPIAPELLKTTSWRMYVDISDVIICFQYPSNPVLWENSDGDRMEIQTIGFVLPEKTWSEDNTRGFFLISQTEHIGYNEGIYTYYFPPEIANDFWGFIIDARLNEVTSVPGKTLSVNDVIILSQKGADLTLADLEGYAYEETGDALLYTRTYPINAQWQLLVHHGGGLEKPMTVWLNHVISGKHVDITQGNETGAITDFISSQNPQG